MGRGKEFALGAPGPAEFPRLAVSADTALEGERDLKTQVVVILHNHRYSTDLKSQILLQLKHSGTKRQANV